jgi:hypothetical protein
MNQLTKAQEALRNARSNAGDEDGAHCASFALLAIAEHLIGDTPSTPAQPAPSGGDDLGYYVRSRLTDAMQTAGHTVDPSDGLLSLLDAVTAAILQSAAPAQTDAESAPVPARVTLTEAPDTDGVLDRSDAEHAMILTNLEALARELGITPPGDDVRRAGVRSVAIIGGVTGWIDQARAALDDARAEAANAQHQLDQIRAHLTRGVGNVDGTMDWHEDGSVVVLAERAAQILVAYGPLIRAAKDVSDPADG